MRGTECRRELTDSTHRAGRAQAYHGQPAGLADHWKRAPGTWADFGAFVAWAGRVKVTALHGSPVIHSLW